MSSVLTTLLAGVLTWLQLLVAHAVPIAGVALALGVPAVPEPRRRKGWMRRARIEYGRWKSGAPLPPVTVRLGEAQRMVFSHPARFRVLVAGRRFGKTWLAVIELVLAALMKRGALCWYVAPTREQARDLAWEALKAVLRLLPSSYVVSVSETRLSVRFRNGSLIQLKSAHKPDVLRGRALDFVVVDECALISKVIWEEILLPALADRQGRALLITTPKGFNWVYDEYLKGIPGRWDDHAEQASWTFTTLDGGRVPAAEVEARRAARDPRAFRQEYLASFEALGNRVYDAFDRDLNVQSWVRDRVQEILRLQGSSAILLFGVDFNVNPMSAVVAVRDGKRCLVAACLQPMTSRTDELAGELVRQWGDPNPEKASSNYKKPRRRLIAYPDASGNHRDTRSGTTDHQLLINAGFVVDAPAANPDIIDRVNAVNAMLCDANGDRKLFIDPAAAHLIRSLDGQVWKDGTRIPDKGTGKKGEIGYDHANDALGYLIHRTFNLLGAQWSQSRVQW